MPYVIGTAGHIDHGKTALIKALTGQDTDRLKEEKERGISIDLGFAHLDLPDGTRAGIVDVPGHERFIRNMLAGAHGIDLALVVVAADDGVMPQTEEHLDIVRLLGIPQAIFVVGKADLAPPGRIAEVEEEIRILALDTPYENAPLLAVSARTGQGLPELREAIAAALARLRPARAGGYFRLPVDRAFVRPGHGLVITGTALSGEIALGERIRCLPGGGEFRVRGIQVHGQAQERAGWGQRVALNLAGADSADVRRGHVVCHEKLSVATDRFDAFVEIRGGGGRPIRNHARLRMYLGTAEHLVKVSILVGGSSDGTKGTAPESTGSAPETRSSVLEPKSSAYCQIRFREPVLAMRGDRFILRDEAAQRTLGGGMVVHPWAGRHRRGEVGLVERLDTLRAGDLAAVARIAIDDSAAFALPIEAIAQFLNVRADEALAVVKAIEGLRVIDAEGEKRYAGEAKWRSLEESVRGMLGKFHAAQPLAAGMDLEELRSRLPYHLSPQLFRAVVNQLIAARLAVRDESTLRLPGHRVEVGSAERALMEKVRSILGRDPMAPPELKEIEKETGAPGAKLATVLRLMEKDGSIVRVVKDLYFLPGTIEQIRERFAGHLAEKGEITAAGFRDLIGSTRKYVIPLLEYFDRVGVTVRVGDMRRLKRPAAAAPDGAKKAGGA